MQGQMQIMPINQRVKLEYGKKPVSSLFSMQRAGFE